MNANIMSTNIEPSFSEVPRLLKRHDRTRGSEKNFSMRPTAVAFS
jgi:hypothetical protein